MNVVNFKGVVKNNIKFSESEGKFSNLDVMNNFLIMWTKNNYLRVFQIGRREPK